MATIEERANKNGLAYQFCKESIEADHKIFEKGYIKGATEQKAIDINEACRMLCKTCEGGNGSGRPCIKPCHRYVGFKKGLEG